jgi:DNA topoisomerase-2
MQIMKTFFKVRLDLYQKRKDYLEGILQAESAKLSNQGRFIVEKCDGTIVIENKKKKDMISELVRRGYDSDPVIAWKLTQNREEVLVRLQLLKYLLFYRPNNRKLMLICMYYIT